MQEKHVKLNDKLANEINRIHNSRKNRCKRKQTMSDTMRLLLYIGVNQYNSESGFSTIRNAERQRQREERAEEIKQQPTEEEEKPERIDLIKII